ncbi:ATP-binding protein [Saccharothrix algeriensis]|uniref:Anti-sigma regulatory factor (Ser/Thr protein kinase) n=2 Tax=Saccharothrix algeriensis TaxID=173560 RepID=A0ABS2SD94_9PSEU|nr:ATP-binding protein [Saccharothrix algeriensis]MBM7814194.1 anti-sigma regulatory factor (Ser/Thr protein kinase) [Saccharothrix algeriensis]
MDVPTVNPVVEYSPPRGPGGAGLARDFTRRTLAAWGYRGVHDDVVLAVSELVANAVRHAGGPAVLRLAGGADRVRVEVADGSPVRPGVRPAGVTGGWGLPLVDRLCRRWGVEPDGRGKVVWCELA